MIDSDDKAKTPNKSLKRTAGKIHEQDRATTRKFTNFDVCV